MRIRNGAVNMEINNKHVYFWGESELSIATNILT
jgi:hypothetical protein